jgi:hypothetical protein
VQKFGIAVSIIIFTVLAHAQLESSKVLSLAQWRQQQITEAENRTIRVSNRIKIVRQTTGNLNEINRLESELRIAAQSAEMVRELTIEDYFNIYLSQFADSDATLVEAAKSMSKSEVATLLKALLKARTTSASLEQSSPYLTGLAEKQNSESKL